MASTVSIKRETNKVYASGNSDNSTTVVGFVGSATEGTAQMVPTGAMAFGSIMILGTLSSVTVNIYGAFDSAATSVQLYDATGAAVSLAAVATGTIFELPGAAMSVPFFKLVAGSGSDFKFVFFGKG